MGEISKINQKARRKLGKALTIVCRCEEVTEEEVRQAIRDGCRTLEEIKRTLRVGMGHCGGRGCLRIIARIIQEMAGTSMAHQRFPRSRPPLKPLPLKLLGGYKDEAKDC